jgi:hypothetical protein
MIDDTRSRLAHFRQDAPGFLAWLQAQGLTPQTILPRPEDYDFSVPVHSQKEAVEQYSRARSQAVSRLYVQFKEQQHTHEGIVEPADPAPQGGDELTPLISRG